ncbi:cellulose synthase/poly-beta-1,6-N-acetylglucosamine synthase-like glycosyltransferase [Micromonospora pisi]|uniref:Beta-monoglucosyldiacylglycerol synthase n=1 Tax=Micromonospora pisi TaxID=589240 RepID=A0A495JW97_9ACTN|nr:glycosyltransferase family 2 protein [Micromonospora pisi]RKR92534.1 cellulose synthase/poly-beta-1,6-N-acetylglucosamine synthase-like glycosyltransferase [Micromonospora pisi]
MSRPSAHRHPRTARRASASVPRTALRVAAALTVVAAVALRPAWAYQAVALALTAVFATYLIRHLVFLTAALRPIPAEADDTTDRPLSVTVLVPCHNEARVIDGLTAALAALDYPAHLIEVVFVDDRSADGTGDLLERAVVGHRGWRVLRRAADAVGGKSAALNDALRLARGEVVVVFDADHQPAPDCLRELLRPFADPRVAAVQGRCVVRNPRDSLVARLVAVDYLCGYLVNMAGRDRVHGLPAYGGANCAVRTDVLRELGGWNVESVTEDTDLSLRIWLRGYRIGYAEHAVDTELAVTGLGAYYRQRYRWARGHQQVCRDYRRPLWRSPRLRLREKIEATLFLYVFHVPVLCVLALLLAGITTAVPGLLPSAGPLWAIAPLMAAGPVLEVGGGLLRAGARRRDLLPLLLFPALFVISMLLCTRAMLDAWAGSRYAWVKTERTALDPNAAVHTERAARDPRAVVTPA